MIIIATAVTVVQFFQQLSIHLDGCQSVYWDTNKYLIRANDCRFVY